MKPSSHQELAASQAQAIILASQEAWQTPHQAHLSGIQEVLGFSWTGNRHLPIAQTSLAVEAMDTLVQSLAQSPVQRQDQA
jgi:hypothetical protein